MLRNFTVATLRERKPGVWEIRVFTGRDSSGRPTQISRTVIEPNMAVAHDPIMRVNRRGYMPRQPSLPAPQHPHASRAR